MYEQGVHGSLVLLKMLKRWFDLDAGSATLALVRALIDKRDKKNLIVRIWLNRRQTVSGLGAMSVQRSLCAL
jgi:hypothetical protein